MPNSQANSKSARSFSDNAATGRMTSGTFTPLRFEIVPPLMTSHSAKSAPQDFTRSRILPSLTNSVASGRRAAKISGWGRQTRVLPPSAVSKSMRKAAPFSNSSSPLANEPTRSFGPCKSARIPIGLLSSASICRIRM